MVIIAGKSGSGKTHTAWEFYNLFNKTRRPIYLPLAFQSLNDDEEDLYDLVAAIEDAISKQNEHIFIVDDLLLFCIGSQEGPGESALKIVKRHLEAHKGHSIILLVQDSAVSRLEKNPGPKLGIPGDEIVLIEPKRCKGKDNDNKEDDEISDGIVHHIMLKELQGVVSLPRPSSKLYPPYMKDHEFYKEMMQEILIHYCLHSDSAADQVFYIQGRLAKAAEDLLNGGIVKPRQINHIEPFDRILKDDELLRFLYILFTKGEQNNGLVLKFSTFFSWLYTCAYSIIPPTAPIRGNSIPEPLSLATLSSMVDKIAATNVKQSFVARLLFMAHLCVIIDTATERRIIDTSNSESDKDALDKLIEKLNEKLIGLYPSGVGRNEENLYNFAVKAIRESRPLVAGINLSNNQGNIALGSGIRQTREQQQSHTPNQEESGSSQGYKSEVRPAIENKRRHKWRRHNWSRNRQALGHTR